jgi:alkanesulfonate monooxygenase SsuD/methylene tetrahydromethanopterin reductase-like flavin-dependent oxidoreductase (luciferase family)
VRVGHVADASRAQRDSTIPFTAVWHIFAKTPDEARGAVERFDALCRTAGRDPATVEKAVSFAPPDLAGRPLAEVRDRVQAFVDAGIRHFILSLPAPYDRELLRRWGREVAPAFRA